MTSFGGHTGYQVGGFRFDPTTGELVSGDEVIPLTARAADTLRLLADRANTVVTKEDLIREVWQGALVEDNNVNQQIESVRRALSHNGGGVVIETLPRRGYRLVGPVQLIPLPGIVVPPATAPATSITTTAVPQTPVAETRLSSRRRAAWMVGGVVMIVAIAATIAWPWYQRRQIAQKSAATMARGIEQMTAGNPEAAVRIYQEAIVIDPNNAGALSALAHALNNINNPAEIFTRAQGQSPSVDAARRAVEIDPKCGPCRGTYGFFLFYHDWAWTQAEREFREALRLSPEQDSILPAFSMLLGVTGRTDEALQMVDRALEGRPYQVSWLIIRASTLYLARRYDDTLAAADRVLAVTSREKGGWDWRSMALFQLGRGDEAVRALGKVLLAPHAKELDVALAAGGVNAGLKKLLEVTEDEPSRIRFSWRRAAWRALLHDPEGAMDELETALRTRNVNAIFMAADPVYDDIRSTPRFQELLKLLNLGDPGSLPISSF